jgi:hypothetical protein
MFKPQTHETQDENRKKVDDNFPSRSSLLRGSFPRFVSIVLLYQSLLVRFFVHTIVGSMWVGHNKLV